MQIFTNERLLILFLTASYTIGFGAWFVIAQNLEFIWYVVTLSVFIALVATTFRQTRFPNGILWALSGWGLLHVLGGGILVGDGVLYEQVLFELYNGGDLDSTVLKYDQFVHAYGFAVTALALRFLLREHAPSLGAFGRMSFAALGSMGLSVVNEIVEFTATIMFSETGVGGYFNVSLDLVFNTVGAVLAVIIAEVALRLKSRVRIEKPAAID